MEQKIAFVFPGQGSQAAGMLDGYIAENPDIVAQTCSEASDIIGYDMAALIREDSNGKLNQTIYTQPALLTASVAAWRIWKQECIEQPQILAGHSLGEYSALVCAEAMTFEEGLKLVAKRGELMQNAVAPGEGAMAAVLGLSLEKVVELCEGIDAQPANINSPGQVVVAGTTDAVNTAVTRAKEFGAKRAIILPVSVPSHCFLMEGAAKELESELKNINWSAPKVPVIHNYDVCAHSDAAGISNALQKQLYNPVRWIETIEYIVASGLNEIIECGPGKVLTGLNKRIAPGVTNRAMSESLGVGLC